jgi:hypothetical protein
MRFWNNRHQVRNNRHQVRNNHHQLSSNRNIGKPNDLKGFESNENEYFNIDILLTDLIK